MHGNPGMYIYTGLLGNGDKVFRCYLLYPAVLLATAGISIIYEFKKFKQCDRFYKKFNLFNTF
jgi:hypothetical protein